MSFICPKGHVSTDADYCSDCGARMDGPPRVAAAVAVRGDASPDAPPPAANDDPHAVICPDCATPRDAGARFCEVCRYDFQAGAAQGAAPRPSQAVPAPPPPPPPDPRPVLLIMVDPTLVKQHDPAALCPADTPRRLVPIDPGETLLGRRAQPDPCQQIVIEDPALSRRHLKLTAGREGALTVEDLGSSNGTLLNGAALAPGIAAPLAPGDRLTLGMWTRLEVQPTDRPATPEGEA